MTRYRPEFDEVIHIFDFHFQFTISCLQAQNVAYGEHVTPINLIAQSQLHFIDIESNES